MTKIPATSIQRALLSERGYPGDEPCFLAYDGGWYWETSTWSTRATDQEAADALLERVCQLEGQITDMQYRAQLGDALQQALQAQELIAPALQEGVVIEQAGDIPDFLDT